MEIIKVERYALMLDEDEMKKLDVALEFLEDEIPRTNCNFNVKEHKFISYMREKLRELELRQEGL